MLTVAIASHVERDEYVVPIHIVPEPAYDNLALAVIEAATRVVGVAAAEILEKACYDPNVALGILEASGVSVFVAETRISPN